MTYMRRSKKNKNNKNNISQNIRIMIFIISLIIIPIWIFSRFFFIGINLSDSIDGKVFIVLKNKNYIPKNGDFIAFITKKDQQFFQNKQFFKKIIGINGDIIIRNNREYIINNNNYNYNYKILAKTKSLKQQDLIHWQENYKVKKEQIVVPKNHYFVATNHQDSYDSRYFGLINQSQIIGRGWIIW